LLIDVFGSVIVMDQGDSSLGLRPPGELAGRYGEELEIMGDDEVVEGRVVKCSSPFCPPQASRVDDVVKQLGVNKRLLNGL
jgi:hypothetical protein